MLYTAVTVRDPDIAFVRLAVPAASVQQLLRQVIPLTLLAMALGTGVALALAWAFSLPLSRRVAAIASGRRSLRCWRLHASADRLRRRRARSRGAVARRGGRRARRAGGGSGAQPRAHGGDPRGHGGGVLVLDEDGRVRLVNEAARRMLGITDEGIGRRYTDSIRHPDIVAQIGRALRGEEPPGVELTFGVDSSRVLIARAAPTRGPAGARRRARPP